MFIKQYEEYNLTIILGELEGHRAARTNVRALIAVNVLGEICRIPF
jgi:hypothetical protein